LVLRFITSVPALRRFRMTVNQRRAVRLAEGILSGAIVPTMLSEEDWALMLLAAELNNTRSIPSMVARRILQREAEHLGYFGSRSLEPAPIG
jgi:hypothetical protein